MCCLWNWWQGVERLNILLFYRHRHIGVTAIISFSSYREFFSFELSIALFLSLRVAFMSPALGIPYACTYKRWKKQFIGSSWWAIKRAWKSNKKNAHTQLLCPNVHRIISIKTYKSIWMRNLNENSTWWKRDRENERYLLFGKQFITFKIESMMKRELETSRKLNYTFQMAVFNRNILSFSNEFKLKV